MTQFYTPATVDAALRGMSAQLAAHGRSLTRTQRADVETAVRAFEAPSTQEFSVTSPALERVRGARDDAIDRGERILRDAAAENRDLHQYEESELAAIKTDVEHKNERINDMAAQENEVRQGAEWRRPYADTLSHLATSGGSGLRGGGTHVYRPDTGPSFLLDMLAAKEGDADAADRLRRNSQIAADRPEYRTGIGSMEVRAGTSGSTSFGSFIPPVWVLDEIAQKARVGRVVPEMVRPGGPPTSTSMTIPRITTGTLTAIQATENTSLGTTDIISAQLTLTTSTIGGYQDVSVQGVELSPIGGGIDQLVFGDLIADYNRALDSQCIIGTGASNQLLGLDTLSGVNAVTYTDASPTVGELYSKLADAVQQVHTGRFAPPDAILMHPRRWAWICAASDSTGRPLVGPSGAQLNSPATFSSTAAQGAVGEAMGLPIYTSANIPTTVGAGTEDEIYVARFGDMLLYEGPVRAEVFRDIGSANATVRFRVYSFCNLFAGRFPAGVSRLRGTGLISPTF